MSSSSASDGAVTHKVLVLRRGGGTRAARLRRAVLGAAASVAIAAGAARAQGPAPMERLSFQDAVRRAVENNASAAIAAAAILRAEGLLSEAQSATRLQVNGTVATTTLNTGVSFEGV